MPRKRSEDSGPKQTSFADHEPEAGPTAEEIKLAEEEEKAREKGHESVEYMRVEDVFIVPAVGTFQEDFDLDGQEYCLSCCTTPRPTMCDSTLLGRKRKQIICPNCLARIKTYIDHGFKKRALGHSWVVPFVGFCCALYLFPCFHTVRHYCPQCRVFLGQRRGLLSVKERDVEDRDSELVTQQGYYQKKEGEMEMKQYEEDTKEREKVKNVRRKMLKKQKKQEKKLKRRKKRDAAVVLEEEPVKAEPLLTIPEKSTDQQSVSSGEELQHRHNRPSKGESSEEPSTSARRSSQPLKPLSKEQQTESLLPGTEDPSETSLDAETQERSKEQQRAISKPSKHSQGHLSSKKHEQPKEVPKHKKLFKHSKQQGVSEPPEQPVREPSKHSQVPVSSDQPKQPTREPSKQSQVRKLSEQPEPVKEPSKQSQVPVLPKQPVQPKEYSESQTPTNNISTQAPKGSVTQPSLSAQVAHKEKGTHAQKSAEAEKEPTKEQGESKESSKETEKDASKK